MNLHHHHHSSTQLQSSHTHAPRLGSHHNSHHTELADDVLEQPAVGDKRMHNVVEQAIFGATGANPHKCSKCRRGDSLERAPRPSTPNRATRGRLTTRTTCSTRGASAP
eukprot:2072789-Prymnesium_polylepis.1